MRVSAALVHVSVSGVVSHTGCAAVQTFVFVAVDLISTPVPAAAMMILLTTPDYHLLAVNDALLRL